jgi:hypothetical protein
MPTKICTKCGIEKDIENFYPRKGYKDGHDSWCRDCHLEVSRDPMQKRKKNEWRMKRLYNLTLEEIDNMLILQEHKCVICHKSLHETYRCIDHDHKTGKVRGILCRSCNTMLGQVCEDVQVLKDAITYLEMHK